MFYLLKKLKKLLFVVILFTILWFTNNINFNAIGNSDNNIYCSISVEENFVDNSIFIVVNNDEQRVYTEEDFSEYNCINIVDFTDYEDFTSNDQILLLEFETHDKENIIRIIDEIILRDDVVFAGPDYIINGCSSATVSELTEDQWAIESINAEQCWEFLTGCEDVYVGVIDTGIEGDHSDLEDNIINNLCWEFRYGLDRADNNPTDSSGHGTHVAGIIGANGTEVTGVCQEVGLISLATLMSDGYFTTSLLAKAIQYASDNDIKLLNLSAGIPLFSEDNDYGSTSNQNNYYAIELVIESYDGLIVCAAGNSGVNIDYNLYVPASLSCDNIIVVGAIDSNDELWNDGDGISNYGNFNVDIYAPGVSIYSTNIGNDYLCASGTSQAAPFVTGVAALLMSVDPSISSEEIKEAIIYGSDLISITLPNGTESNVKKLNAYNSLKNILLNNYSDSITLNNSDILMNKSILYGNSYFNNKNAFYKINVPYNNDYQFTISSNNALDVIIYDDELNVIETSDLNSNDNIVEFIKTFNTGTYYLRAKYNNNNISGNITIGIEEFEPTNLSVGTNNLISNYDSNKSQYFYSFTPSVSGMYNICLTGNTTNGELTYENQVLTIYDDEDKDVPMKRLDTSLYYLNAVTSDNCNNLTVYLQSGFTYYIDVNLINNNINSLYMEINIVNDMEEVDVGISNTYNIMTNETQLGDNLVQLDVIDNATVGISYDYNGTQTETIYFVLYKEVYDQTSQTYELQLVFPEMMVPCGESFDWSTAITDGIYYIGYYNKTNINSTISIEISSN